MPRNFPRHFLLVFYDFSEFQRCVLTGKRDIATEHGLDEEGEVELLLVDAKRLEKLRTTGVRTNRAVTIVDNHCGVVLRCKLKIVLDACQILGAEMRDGKGEFLRANKQTLTLRSGDIRKATAVVRAVFLRTDIGLKVLRRGGAEEGEVRSELLIFIGLIRTVTEVTDILEALNEGEGEAESRQEGDLLSDGGIGINLQGTVTKEGVGYDEVGHRMARGCTDGKLRCNNNAVRTLLC